MLFKEMKRYSLLIPFDLISEAKVDRLKDIAKKQLNLKQINKVPLFIEDRDNMDTLPTHITLYVWDDMEGLIPKIEKVARNISQFEIPIVGAKYLVNGKNLLFLESDNKKLYEINRSLHGIHPSNLSS